MLGGLLEVSLDTLQVVNGGKRLLQFRLQPPLGLVQVSTYLLLTLKTVFKLIQGGLEPSLDLVPLT